MKREALIRELRALARKSGKRFEVAQDHGKGSHYRVTFGARFTIIKSGKSGELKPGYVALVKKQLGLE
jgi:hypothetical protein